MRIKYDKEEVQLLIEEYYRNEQNKNVTTIVGCKKENEKAIVKTKVTENNGEYIKTLNIYEMSAYVGAVLNKKGLDVKKVVFDTRMENAKYPGETYFDGITVHVGNKSFVKSIFNKNK